MQNFVKGQVTYSGNILHRNTPESEFGGSGRVVQWKKQGSVQGGKAHNERMPMGKPGWQKKIEIPCSHK